MFESIQKHKQVIYISLVCVFVFIFVVFGLPKVLSSHYVFDKSQNTSLVVANSLVEKKEPVFVPSYVSTPEPLKAIYMTSWVAGTKSLRDQLVQIIEDTEVNTIVIDIKDYSGKIVYPVEYNQKLKEFGSEEIRVPDLRDFIEKLHKKNIYVIGRVAVFQDAYFVKHRPEFAVRNKSGSAVWKDRKGISWIDVGAVEYWDYIVDIAKESHQIGFDEINFDYIRFPSDGNMQDISFPWSSTTPRDVALKNFFVYLHKHLEGTDMKTSADLFGMTTTETNDMGIGQIFENAFPYFDYVMPMVYPSHYPSGFIKYKNPAQHPYELIQYTMKSAVDRRNALATSTGQKLAELRPWLQDFDLGADYGPKEVRDQIKATYDVGLTSWALWSASNKYTKSALEK